MRLDKIKVNEDYRLRTRLEKRSEFLQLIRSIKMTGLLYPVIINEDFELLAGFRRYYAFKDLRKKDYKYNEIPCKIVDESAQVVQAIENGTQAHIWKKDKQKMLESIGL